MRDLPNYAEGHQLCAKLCAAHNRIIPRSLDNRMAVWFVKVSPLKFPRGTLLGTGLSYYISEKLVMRSSDGNI